MFRRVVYRLVLGVCVLGFSVQYTAFGQTSIKSNELETAPAGTQKCCANCSKTSCNTCNTPSTNPITHEQYCPALQKKGTCTDDGSCTPGWMLKNPGFKAP